MLKPAVARLDGIDVLRGLSILGVILLHIWIRFVLVNGMRLGHDWPRPLRTLVWQNGGNGVTVFFAVSGFLITLTSLRRFGTLRSLRPKVFYRIRFARIMPLLLLLLAVLSALHLVHAPDYRIDQRYFTLPRALFSALTFHLNWLEAARNRYLPPCWTVLWSLSIEEMFYLFFPIACIVLARRGRWGMSVWFGLALALVALGPFARVAWSHTDLQTENSYLAGMSDIAVGCVAAWLTDWVQRNGRVPRRRTLVLLQAAGWVPILFFATWPRWHWVHSASLLVAHSGTDDTLLALGASVVAASVVLSRTNGSRWTAPLRWFGRHSYELYLSHEFLVLAGVHLYARRFPNGSPRGVLAAFVIGIVLATAPLAWALARWFTEPANRALRGAAMAK